MMSKIIIDANVAHEFATQSREAIAILTWLKRNGRLAMGGLNLIELQKTKIGPLLVALKSAGRAIQFDAESISIHARTFSSSSIKSDDPHILGLALASGARLLFSRDRPLQRDFANPALLNNPRGKCFTNASRHKHLLN